ncbi:MAG: DNRLRE domain-containing protein, partial [Chloroflexota bacterium]
TPTSSSTPVASATPFPTSTTTPTPTVTQTQPPFATPFPSLTPTITPTAAQRTFGGTVYQGGCGDMSRPLSGVRVHLLGSNVAGHPGTFLTFAESDANGQFSITHTGSYLHYSLVEIEKAGFASSCVMPGTGGIVPDSTGNWVEFRNVSAASYGGTKFFDYATANLTPSATATEGAPQPTPGGATYVSKRGLEDTFLNERVKEQNYGAVGYLHLGQAAEGAVKTVLIKFDLSDIPSGAVISEARLTLYGTGLDGSLPLDAAMLKRSWTEMQATWKQARTDEPWDANGALGGEDHEAALFRATFTDGGMAQLYRWQVADVVQQWVSGSKPNHGFLVLPAAGSKAKETLGLYSSEYGVVTLQPYLVLFYTVPTPTPTLTPTPTHTPTPTATATPSGKTLWLPLALKSAS